MATGLNIPESYIRKQESIRVSNSGKIHTIFALKSFQLMAKDAS